MGFSLKKAVKSVKKVAKTATSAVKKIASGDVKGGIGDLSQGAAGLGLDIATGGNKGIVDGLTGGLLTSAELAARGNSKDIARVGIVAGATAAGGPTAGFAVNNVLSQGGNYLQAAMAAGTGGEVSILTDASNFLGGNDPLAKLASGALSKLTSSPKSAPRISSAPAVQTISIPSDSGMSTGMMIGLGVGALALIGGLIYFLKNRK